MPTRLSHPVPPRATMIELRVIGALLEIGDHTDLRAQKAMLTLDEHCFCSMDTREMYEIIKSLFNQQKDFSYVDFISAVPDHLYEFVYRCTEIEFRQCSYLESDIGKLLAYRTYRKQLRILVDAVNDAQEAITPEDSLEVISEKLQAINQTQSTTRKAYLRGYEIIAEEMLTDISPNEADFKIDVPGLPPVPNRSLITIAGQSGHGKTFFGMHLMDKIIDARPGKQSLYFNLEMDERVMIERHATLLGYKGDTKRETVKNAIHMLLPKNVSLISEPMITIDEIETECRLASMRQHIAVIVVDYIGLIRTKTKFESKHIEQSDIAKRLAALSLELDCVVICLIQVNRDIKNRPVGDRCPVPTDAAESMGTVHSSSWWLGVDQPQNDDDADEWRDMFMVQCRKNRGENGTFKTLLRFKGGTFSKWQKPFACYTRPKLVEPPVF